MKRIPLFTSHLTDKDIAEGERVLRRNYRLSKGEEVVEFERALAEYVGRKYCVVVNSGCSAIFIAIRALQRTGLEVRYCLPSFTYHGVFHVFDYSGGYIKTNVEPDVFSIDGIHPHNVLTHIAGFPAKYSIENNGCMIEDACQGFGASINGRKIGTFGQITILSFCQNKLITTGGEGGALITDNPNIYRSALFLSEYNYRMSSHAAAIGLSQLSRIDEIIEERRRQAHILNKVYPCALKELPGHYQTYQMYLVKPEVEVPDYVETKMRFDACELLKEIPLALSQVVADQSEQK